jgi:subtilisin family serine protease
LEEGDYETYNEMRDSGDFLYVNISRMNETHEVKSTMVNDDYSTPYPLWYLDRVSKRSIESYDTEYSSTNYGENVDIYILDGGVNYGHPEFANAAYDGGPRARSINHNSTTSDSWYIDADGSNNSLGTDTTKSAHGQWCAMCAAGKNVGTAPDATIISVKTDLTDASILSSIDKIILHHKNKPDRRHSVLSISFGQTWSYAAGSSGTMGLAVEDDTLSGTQTRDSLQAAIDAGITVVTSAGNGAKYMQKILNYTAGHIPGEGVYPVETRVYRNSSAPTNVRNGDAWWDSTSGSEAGYSLYTNLWAKTVSSGYVLHDGYGGNTAYHDLSSYFVLEQSGLYAQGPFSITDGSHVTVFYTPFDPSLWYYSGQRYAPVDGDIWVEVFLLSLPCKIKRRVSGSWVDSGNTVAIFPDYGKINAGVGGYATLPESITVGATDVNDNLAYFTSYGGSVDLYAPGVDIVVPEAFASNNTEGDVKTVIQGTSFSSPLTAGLAAIFLNDKTQPGAGGAVASGAAASDVSSHLINNASPGINNRNARDTDILYKNSSNTGMPLGGNTWNTDLKKDWLTTYNAAASGAYMKLSDYNLGFDWANFHTKINILEYKIAKVKSPITDSTVISDETILRYHPSAGWRYCYFKWDFTHADIEEYDYLSLDSTVHDRIVFNTFVDKSIKPFQSDVTDIEFSYLNNNKVKVDAGTKSWNGEAIGNPVYTITSGSLPASVSLNTDGSFVSNVTNGASSSKSPFTVQVTDDLGGSQSKNYTGSLSSRDFYMKIFDENQNVTFDSDTRGHSLLEVFDIVGEGSSIKSFSIPDFPDGTSVANISITASLIKNDTYTWDNISLPVRMSSDYTPYFDRTTNEVKIKIKTEYHIDYRESCMSVAHSTFKNKMRARFFVWYVNRTNHDYNKYAGRIS